jgi:raffinose/stachyose/melibiose transport system permease protein
VSTTTAPKKPMRWHIPVFLAPAVLIYTLVMLVPLLESLYLSLYKTTSSQALVFNGFGNYVQLFTDPDLSGHFWNALVNNIIFFIINMLVQNPIGVLLAALLSLPRLPGREFYRTIFFLPTMLSFVIVGFVWKLLLSPTWGVASGILKSIGLGWLYAPWLGQTHTALITLSLISVWQFVGIPMMLIYAALIAIPDEITEAAACDGVTGLAQFFKIKLPLIWPAIGIVSILTFVGNFNAFDLIYVAQGTLAGPAYSTDLLGTFFYRTFFGYAGPGDAPLGATIAGVMFMIILAGVVFYLFAVQRRFTHYRL